MTQPGPRSVDIRRARRHDWRELAAAFREIFPDDLPGDELGARLAIGFRNIYVADAAEGMLGFYTITINEDPTRAWLDYLAVLPVARRAGLGRTLLSHFESTAVERGFQKAGLAVRKVNVAALSLYESEGYTRVGESGPGWVLEKQLASTGSFRVGRLDWSTRPVRAIDRLLYAMTVRLLPR